MEEDGEDVAMDFDCLGRDALFEEHQLFAVWSAEDVRSLIARLAKLHGVAE